jgi:hypothetical protein
VVNIQIAKITKKSLGWFLYLVPGHVFLALTIVGMAALVLGALGAAGLAIWDIYNVVSLNRGWSEWPHLELALTLVRISILGYFGVYIFGFVAGLSADVSVKMREEATFDPTGHRLYLKALASLPELDEAFEAFRNQDYSKSYKLYLEAAQLGNAAAQYAVGTLVQTGQGVSSSVQGAENWYRRAAEQDLPKAQHHLAGRLIPACIKFDSLKVC